MSFFVDLLFDKRIQSRIFLIPPSILDQMDPNTPPIFDSFVNNSLSLNHGSIILKDSETKVYLGENVGILIYFSRNLIPLKNFELQICPDTNFQVTLSSPKSIPVQSLPITLSGIDLYQSTSNTAFFTVIPRMDGLLKLTADISFYIEQKKLSFSKKFAFQVCLPFYASIRVRPLFQTSNYNNYSVNDFGSNFKTSFSNYRRRSSSNFDSSISPEAQNSSYINPNCQDYITEFSLANVRRPLYNIQVKFLLNPAYKCDDNKKQLCEILNSKSVVRSLFIFHRVNLNSFPKNVGNFVITWTTEKKETFSSKLSEPIAQFKNPILPIFNALSIHVSKSPSNGIIMKPFSLELSLRNLLDKPISFKIQFDNSEQNSIFCNEEKIVDNFQPNTLLNLTFLFLPISEGILQFPNALITISDSTQINIPLNGGIIITTQNSDINNNNNV